MTIQHSILESYFGSSPGQCISGAGRWAENVDRAFGFGQHGAALGREIALLKGDTRTAEVCGAISSSFGAADATLGALRVITPLERLFTGKMFIAQNPDGTWVRESGHKVRRSLIDVANDLLALIARVFTVVNWFHNKGAYDLGKHSSAMTHTTFGIWGTVITLDTIQTARQMKNDSEDFDGYRERMRKRVADIFCNTLDLIALPFDFGYGVSTSPVLAITGAALNCLSKGSYLIKEALYYD